MSAIKCLACGTENPMDAVRCAFCNQELDRKNIISDPEMRDEDKANPFEQKPDWVNRLDIEPEEESIPGGKPAGQVEKRQTNLPAASVGKPGRLRTLLAGKNKDLDIDALRRESLLPDSSLPEKSSEQISKGHPPFSISEESTPGSAGNPLPEWLRNAEFNQANEQSGTEEAISQAELEASLGDIPDWVQKLQAKITRNEKEIPATENPLPSSHNTSPMPEEDITRKFDQLSVPSTPITGADPGLINTVTTYVKGLKNPKELHPNQNKRLSRISWGILGLGIISLMSALLWSGTSMTTTKEPDEQHLASMISVIDSMPPDSVILVAMEFDLPLAGELENAAIPVLAQVMNKQANMVFVSTRPIGPALSTHLVDLGLKWQPDYTTQKIHISAFLPGGAPGLLRFAIAPQESLPIAANGNELWNSPELAGIQKISDFGLLLLLTDSSESGRDWMEQIQPHLNQAPLFVIASSQAAPVLRPYVESGQITAMVEGISGAAKYEHFQLLTTNNQQLLKAYRGGMMFMAILLACVLVLSIITPGIKSLTQKGTQEHAPE